MSKSTEEKYGIKTYPFKLCAVHIVYMTIITVISGLSALVQIYAVSYFIDSVRELVSNSVWNANVIESFLILVVTISIDWLFPRLQTLIEKRIEIVIIQKYRPVIIQKCAKLKYEYFENSEKWDLINRACKEPEKQWPAIPGSLITLLRLTIKVIGIVAIISRDVWWAAVLILVFCMPIFAFSVKAGRKSYQSKRDASEYTRKYEYFDSVLRNKEFLEERKLFGFTNRIEQKYTESFFEAFWIETKTVIQWAIKTKLSGALSMIAALIIIVTLIGPTVNGDLSLGMFMALVNSVFLLTSEMSWGLSKNVDRLVAGLEFSKDVSELFELEDDLGALDEPIYKEVEKIEFRDVSFKYPLSDKYVLNSVSFVMERGKKYAFVGANGAGKTTVVKLLLGLYRDYSGTILINDKDIKEYSGAERKGFFSAVFQDFIKHSLSIRENCILADPKRKITDDEINNLLKKIELKEFVDTLPGGLNTELGKINESGVELSGGQWQKLAMLRALLRPADVQILDEPTAALDPKMESEVYRMFQSVSEDKLTILISHRLGFSKSADIIFVFDGGTICESGDFSSLIKKSGTFAKMYEEQKKWYEE